MESFWEGMGRREERALAIGVFKLRNMKDSIFHKWFLKAITRQESNAQSISLVSYRGIRKGKLAEQSVFVQGRNTVPNWGKQPRLWDWNKTQRYS